MTPTVSRFAAPDLTAMPEDIFSRIEAAREKSGFVPKVFLGLTHRAAEFRAAVACDDALIDTPGPITKAERAVLDFGMAVSARAHEVGDEECELLVNVSNMPPNNEFYVMGWG